MKIVIIRKSRNHSRMCPWLIDVPSESTEQTEQK